jgi:hypothetical protein
MGRNRGVRGSSVVFPLLLIGIGCMVLASREFPNFDPWPVLGRYWPLLLILVGVGMVWDRSRRPQNPEEPSPFPIGSTLGTVFFLLILALLMWHGRAFAAHEWSRGSGTNSHRVEKIDRKGANAVRMSVKMPAGELLMSGGAEEVLHADFSYGGSWSVPTIEYSVNGGVGQLDVSQGSGGTIVTNSDNNWNLKVNDTIPLDLEVDVGAGRGEFRFAKVNLTRLELNIGAGQADVDLSGERAKDLEAEIQGGVGEAAIHLPKNVGVVAIVHGGLGSVDTRGLKEEDGQYVNEAYGKSPSTIHLTVNGGIGSIKLQQE